MTIDNLPDTVKLVVLLGPNGCGKSSLVESMEVARKIYGFRQIPWDTTGFNSWGTTDFNYYIKQDREISKEYHHKGGIFCAKTQLSKLSFRGGYDITTIKDANYDADIIFQHSRWERRMTLDLVKENFIDIEFHNQTDYNESGWINCFNVRTPYRNIGTQNSGFDDSKDLKQRTWQRLVDGDPFFISNWHILCTQWIKDSSDFFVRDDFSRWKEIIHDTVYSY